MESTFKDIDVQEAIKKARVCKIFSTKGESLYTIIMMRSTDDYHYLEVQRKNKVLYSMALKAYTSADEGMWGYKWFVGEFPVRHPHFRVIERQENRNASISSTSLLSVVLVALTRFLREKDPELVYLIS